MLPLTGNPIKSHEEVLSLQPITFPPKHFDNFFALTGWISSFILTYNIDGSKEARLMASRASLGAFRVVVVVEEEREIEAKIDRKTSIRYIMRSHLSYTKYTLAERHTCTHTHTLTRCGCSN